MRFKKSSILFALFMLVNIMIYCSFTNVKAVSYKWSGSMSNKSITWGVTAGGELYITGKGDPGSYTSSSSLPWYGLRTIIKSVNIADTVTPTSMTYWFNGYTALETVNIIPNSVTNCSDMFKGCTGLKVTPKLHDGITNCSNMFRGCTSLTTITNFSAGSTNNSYMF